MFQKIYRRREVEGLTGKSCTTIYREMQEGTFPKPVRLGKGMVGWPEESLTAWFNERKAASEARQ